MKNNYENEQNKTKDILHKKPIFSFLKFQNNPILITVKQNNCDEIVKMQKKKKKHFA